MIGIVKRREPRERVRDTSNGEKRDRFPHIDELAGPNVPAEAKLLWERAHAHRAPRYWAAFAYVGA